MESKNSTRRARRCDRHGATLVEFAFAAPILFAIFFTAIEFGRMHMIRHSITNAAYEGSRRGITPGATADDVRLAAEQLCNTVFARNAVVAVTPAVISDVTPEVSTTITVPLDANAWVVPHFFGAKNLVVTSTLKRERYESAP